MKKRLKFFISILTLCLVMMTLGFGVYASLSVSYLLDGEINYIVTDTVVDVTTKLYSADKVLSYSQGAKIADSFKDVNLNNLDATATLNGLTLKSADTQLNLDGKLNSSTATGYRNVPYTKEDGYAYFVVINITNKLTTSLAHVIMQDSITMPGSSWTYNTGYIKGFDNTTTNNNIVVAFGIESRWTSVSNHTFNFGIDIKKDEIEATTEKYTIDQANSTLTINSDASGVVVIGKDETSSNLALKSSSTKISRVLFIDDIQSSTSNFITSISSSAFNNCSSLVEMPIPQSVTQIGDSAFYGCSKIVNIDIPENVTSIGSRAFYNCTNLRSVYISSIESWCDIDFSDEISNPLYYAQNIYVNNVLTTNLVIPDTVTTINSYAFYNCTSLQSVTIGSGVQTIENYAFYNCTNLTEINFNATNCNVNETTSTNSGKSNYVFYNAGQDGEGITVNFGNGVIKVPDYLFYPYYNTSSYSPNIKQINWNNVTTIGSNAFAYCDFTSVTIGSGVKSIGNSAFYDCKNLTEINFNATNCTVNSTTSSSNSNNIFRYAGQNSEGITVNFGDNVQKVPDYLFYPYYNTSSYSPNIKQINWNNVTEIGSYAFSYCVSLENITISDKITTIGSNTFSNCTNLQNVTIGSGVQTIGNYAFFGCTNLKNVYIPSIESWCNIGFTNEYSNPLYYAQNLYVDNVLTTNLVIPDTVTTISSYAFYGFKGLSITIGSGVQTIENYAFYNCTNLTEINFNATNCTVNSTTSSSNSNNIFSYAGQSGSGITVTFGSNVQTIPAYLFYPYYSYSSYSPNIKQINWNNVTQIGDYAFTYCVSLENITLSDKITTIGSNSFYYCTNLQSVTIGSGIQTIGGYAFFNCTNLQSVTIDSGVTSIGTYAFYNCTSLQSVTIGSNVTSIGSSAFESCTNLIEINFNATACSDITYIFSDAGQNGEGITVNFGEGVTKVPSRLFCPYSYSSSRSPKLVNVKFEGSVESIGSDAFFGCTNLKNVYIPSIESWCNIGFTNEYSNPLYYAQNLYVDNVLTTNLVIPDTVTTISSYAFYGFKGLSITIGSGVQTIGSSAFSNCTNLTEINYNTNNIDKLSSGNRVFEYAGQNGEGITVNFGNGVIKVPDYLFYPYYNTSSYSPNIKQINWNNVTTIGSNAFEYCNFTSITIGEGIQTIGNSAFYNCTNLQSVTIGSGVQTIGNSAFYNCTNLQSVTIGSGVQTIGDYAFRGCTNLQSVYIPSIESWCNIGFTNEYSNPLYYAQNLYIDGELVTNLVIPDSVTTIKNYAFYNCKCLQSVTLPSTLTSIGSSAFYGCNFSNVTYERAGTGYTFKDGTLTITSMTDSPAWYRENINPLVLDVVFNETFESIGNYAFSGCTSLKSLKIPSYVTNIGNNAFDGCNLDNIVYEKTNTGYTYKDGVLTIIDMSSTGWKNTTPTITQVIFPEGITEIPSRMFSGCKNLQSITIPDTVTTIGSSAFSGCSSLQSVTIGSGVKTIENSSFNGCRNLTEINFNATACSVSEFNEIFYEAGQNGEGITINFGDNVQKVPDYLFNPYNSSSYSPNIKQINWNNVTEIGSAAFYNCVSLENITISDKITTIGRYTFSNCTNLQNVTIGSGVQTIGDYAFIYCTNLQSVYIPSIESWCNIGFTNEYSNPLYYAQNLYVNNVLTTSLVIPDTVTTINSYAFYNCTSLQSVTIGSGVTSIGTYAFYGCTKLTEINYNTNKIETLSSWNNIFSYAGQNGGGITVNFGNGVIKVPDYLFNPYGISSYSPNIKQINWNNVTEIGSYAFAYCNFTSITIGEGIQTIGDYAFSDCTNLTEINFNATACSDLSSSNYIFRYAGQNGEGITVNFGEDATKVPSRLFCPYDSSSYGASSSPNIKQINWNNVTEIGSYAFSYCVSLENITISDKITTIGSYAFSDCTNLQNVTIGSGVQTIGNYAFYGCTKLVNIDIPENVTSIGSRAFNNCTNLRSVYISSIESWCNIGFTNEYSNPLYYAQNLYVNNVLTTSLVIPDTVTTINSYAFYNCTSLQSVTIGSGVTSIGTYAFYNCTKLTEINYNTNKIETLSSWNNIFSYAGQNGGGIKVNFGDGVEKVPDYLFDPYYNTSSYSPNIKQINWNNVTTIGSYAFSYCVSLENITLSDKITTIGSDAFRYCTNLQSVTIGSGVKSIGDSAFYNCTNLTEINFNATACNVNITTWSSSNHVFSYAGQSGSGITVTFGSNVQTIPAYLFYPYYSYSSYSPKIVNVKFEGSVKSIGEGTFYYCDDIQNVFIQNIESWCDVSFSSSTSNPLYYAQNLYVDNVLTTNLVIPNAVETISSYSFYGFKGLSITIPSNVTSIGNSAFSNCTNLTEINYNTNKIETLSSWNNIFRYAGQNGEGIIVNFGDGVEKVPDYLFSPGSASSSSPNIKQINWNNVTTIGSNAFEYCNFTSLTIGEGIQTIGNSAFYNCTNLTEINFNATNCTVNSTTSSSNRNNIFSYAGQSGSGITVNFGDNVEKVPDYLFCPRSDSSYSPNIKQINWNNVTEIGSYAFAYCVSLENITISDKITTIGSNAFYNCTQLNRVTIESVSLANKITYSSSLGYLVNYIVSQWGTVSVRCDDLAQITSSYLKGSTFIQPTEIVNGYAIFKKK